MIKYFTLYALCPEQGVLEDDEDDDVDTGYTNRQTIDQQEEEDDLRLGYLVRRPKACTDNYGMRYTARKRNRLPLWRTHFYHQEEQEEFFYQKIMLYLVFQNVTDVRHANETWRECFFRVSANNNPAFKMPEQEL